MIQLSDIISGQNSKNYKHLSFYRLLYDQENIENFH